MPELPRVKVCGVRDAAGLRAAAGADAVGFVHAPGSPRHVEPARARALVAALPAGVLPVLVVVHATPREGLRLARETGARALQLCGAQRAAEWRDVELPLLRRLGVGPEADAELRRWSGVAAGFVLDHPDAPGGSGRGVDLERAAELARRAPCLLAGGLDGEGVAAAVARVQPRGVDASSRLESSPGIKDPDRVAAFVRAARAALEEVHA